MPNTVRIVSLLPEFVVVKLVERVESSEAPDCPDDEVNEQASQRPKIKLPWYLIGVYKLRRYVSSCSDNCIGVFFCLPPIICLLSMKS